MRTFLLSTSWLIGMLGFTSCNHPEEYTSPHYIDNQYISATQNLTFPQEGGWKTLSVVCDGAWEASADAEWIALSPERGYGDGEITVTARSSEELWGRETEIRIRCGSAEASTSVAQLSDAPVRIDTKGPANCYLLTPGRNSRCYAFDATRKGNSQEPTGIAEVRIVWQDRPELLRRIGYNPESGLIGIVPGDEAGNAVVAALDADGAIRWSWHLWVTAYDPETAVFTSPANAHGSVWLFMDRNIGALDARPGSIDAAGLLYQWGRKDPFPGIGDYSGTERPRYDGSGNPLPTVPEQAAQFGTQELAVANPHLFYKISYKTNDWTSPSDDDLWGGVSRAKTIWDPCPAGWRVPLCDEQGASPYAFLTEGGASWSQSSHGYVYRNWWLPCTGTRVYESGVLSADIGGPYGGMWIGTAGSANPDQETYPALYGQYFFVIDSDLFFGTNKDARSQGMAVRCVKE